MDANPCLKEWEGGVFVEESGRYFPECDSGTALNNAADEALYTAKNGGRNQVVLWEGT